MADKIEPLRLKGKSQPVQAYVVRSVAAPAVNVDFSSQMPFIGHDVFMLSLTYTLKQALGRRRRAVALVGDAGIGKTRIAQQLARAAESSKFKVAWATCTSRNGRKTTWATLLAQLLGIDASQDSDAVRQELHDRLNSLNLLDLEPTLIDLFFISALDKPLEDRLSPGNVDSLSKRMAQRLELLQAVVQFLTVYSEQTPTLLVIDDLQQENAQALATLKQVLDELKQARLVMVVTYEPTLNVELDAQKLIVPDLNEEETDQVALAILHSSELGPRLSKLLWERTSGRPLFIEALLRSLLQKNFIEQGQGYAELKPDADPEMLPDDVRELVISRVDSLPPLTQTVVRAAAVLAEDFTVDALCAVSEHNVPDQMRAILLDLTEAQLIEHIENEVYRFRHGLTQRVIYESLSRAQRLKLHRIAVQYWREHREFTYQPVVLAYHLVKCGLLPQAIEVVTTAAESAAAEGDFERAVELYNHALSIFPEDHSIMAQLERLARLQQTE